VSVIGPPPALIVSRALAEGMTDEQKRGPLLEIVRDYEDLAQRALQRFAIKQRPENG
jgi:hypothetical protein